MITDHNEYVMRQWEAQYLEPPDPYPDCNKCDQFEPCPCDCGYGWCYRLSEFVDGEKEGCYKHTFFDEDEHYYEEDE